LSSELKISFSQIFIQESDKFVFGAATNDSMTTKCSQLQVLFRVSDQGDAKESKAELMIYLKNAVGEIIASGCKWSQPFLPREWIEVEAVFDDEDEIVRLSEPGCRYEVWYKVGGRDEYANHILCVDYFSLLARLGTSSPTAATNVAAAVAIEYIQPNHDCKVCCDIHK
jgi:hypothetical protein